MYIPYCGPLLGRCGCGKAIGGPQIPPPPTQGILEVCSALLSPAAPTSLLCPGGGVEDPPPPPSFCPSYDHHTSWIFCSKISYLPFVPYLLKCSKCLEISVSPGSSPCKLGEDFGALSYQAYGRWDVWLAGRGLLSCGQDCFLHFTPHVRWACCMAPVLGCAPAQQGTCMTF